MRARRVWASLTVLLVTAGGCTCERALRCAAGEGKPEVCRAMAGDCTTVIESTCRGDCPPRCAPDEVAGRCALQRDVPCPVDSRVFDGSRVGNVTALSWMTTRLSPAALALANGPISREAFDALTGDDRLQLCGFGPKDTCRLRWDEALDRATCAVPDDDCARCVCQAKPSRCLPVNRCSGVICL